MNKKIVRELIKEKLDKSEEFREYYNNLEEDEKEEVRKEVSSHKEITDAIQQHDSKLYYNLREEVISLYKEEIIKRGYKRISSKKAKFFSANTIFTYKIEGKYFVSLKVIPHKKGSSFELEALLEIPTLNGKLYAKVDDAHTRKIVYTGHFFDRYAERLNLSGTRDEVVKEFLKESIRDTGIIAIEPTGDTTSKMKKGLGLGTLLVNLILIKTFIADKQSSKHQRELKNNMEEQLLCLAA